MDTTEREINIFSRNELYGYQLYRFDIFIEDIIWLNNDWSIILVCAMIGSCLYLVLHVGAHVKIDMATADQDVLIQGKDGATGLVLGVDHLVGREQDREGGLWKWPPA